jgi:hypothetical protein
MVVQLKTLQNTMTRQIGELFGGRQRANEPMPMPRKSDLILAVGTGWLRCRVVHTLRRGEKPNGSDTSIWRHVAQ